MARPERRTGTRDLSRKQFMCCRLSAREKLVLLDQPTQHTPLFRMEWQSSSLSGVRAPHQSENVAVRSDAFGGLFRINTCKIEELTLLKCALTKIWGVPHHLCRRRVALGSGWRSRLTNPSEARFVLQALSWRNSLRMGTYDNFAGTLAESALAQKVGEGWRHQIPDRTPTLRATGVKVPSGTTEISPGRKPWGRAR
jgi:hypothetical protein